jgi:DNA-binding GntR family transcriptional regulator
VLFPTVNKNTTQARAKGVVDYHRRMLAAIRERDGDKAVQLFDEFIGQVSTTYFKTPK